MSLICNHDNLILKLHQKKISNLIKGGLLYVDSKLEVPNLYINLHNQLSIIQTMFQTIFQFLMNMMNGYSVYSLITILLQARV